MHDAVPAVAGLLPRGVLDRVEGERTSCLLWRVSETEPVELASR
jgi:hypothetical protein